MPDFYIDPDITKASTIDTAFYTNAQYLEVAKEQIFSPLWQYIGDADMLLENNSAFPVMLLDNYLSEPLLLTRDSAGDLHCLSNVCTHRGNIVVYEPCKLNHLQCRYHGRRFALDGKFTFMPEFKEVCDFPTEKDDLHRLHLFVWGKLLFTSLAPAIDASVIFSEMMDRMAWYPIAQLKRDNKQVKTYTVKANWALYCENYLEGFHIPFVHAGLNQALDFGEYTTELFRYSNLQLGIGKHEDECFDLPPSSPDYGKNVAAYYFWVFPNMMFNFYPWGLSFNLVQPTGVSECKVTFITYVLDESKLALGAGTGLDTVELEDEEVVEQVQRGVRSRFYNSGRYSPHREQGTHHFHSLIAEFMGRKV